MSDAATEVLTGVLLTALAAGLVLAFVRLVRGRSLPDRVVALDVLSTASVGIAGVFAIQSGVTVFLDVALVMALISFVGTVAFAFYIEQRSAGGKALMGIVQWLVVAALAGLGTAFVFLSAVGILRMPDLYTRMHASSKAATLGVILILVAVAVRFGDTAVSVRAALICLFLLMTAPVASHVIARAAYRSGVPLAEETTINELDSTESPTTP